MGRFKYFKSYSNLCCVLRTCTLGQESYGISCKTVSRWGLTTRCLALRKARASRRHLSRSTRGLSSTSRARAAARARRSAAAAGGRTRRSGPVAAAAGGTSSRSRALRRPTMAPAPAIGRAPPSCRRSGGPSAACSSLSGDDRVLVHRGLHVQITNTFTLHNKYLSIARSLILFGFRLISLQLSQTHLTDSDWLLMLYYFVILIHKDVVWTALFEVLF